MNNQDFFDDELLEKRIEKFYGYGNYAGKYWFIGKNYNQHGRD